MKKCWLGALAGVMLSTAAPAQAPVPKPKKAAAVPSTQEILDSEFDLIVLQLKGPVSKNIFIQAGDSRCPNGGDWRPILVCTSVKYDGTCASYSVEGYSCQ